ncbi:MAG TPA: M20/M25/M40 family metallo-hydrolase, partial [Gemmatimonadales bacterium]|nr:M20/M25/M40 family metallo-hydrolase [Gemmatimonadales bacterium]
MRRLLEAAALAALVTAGVRHGLVPPPLPDAEPSRFEFSAGRAARHVRQLARSPRPPGSAGHEWSRTWLGRMLGILGADTLTQEVVQPSPRAAKAAVVRNLAGRLRGTEGGPAVLLVAHYDGHAASPGAGDDASGVAILIEVMRALRVGPPLRHDVIALFTDAEEEGMLGARAFVGSHPWRGDVGVVINVDARGAGGRSLMFETGTPNLATVAAYAEEVRSPTASSLFDALYRLLPNDTDFTELRTLGRPGLNFAFLGDVAAYHTPLDSAGRLDPRLLQSQGEAVLELARRFALAGPPADSAGGGSAVFFSAPLVGLVSWPLDYTWALTAATLLLLAAGIGFGLHRGRLRAGGVVLGVTGTLVAAGLAVACAIGLRLGLGALLVRHSTAGVLEQHPALALAPLALGAGVGLGLLRLARRWATPDALSAGAAIPWMAGAVALAARLPPGSYFCLVPMAGASAGLLVRALLSDETGAPWARWVATLALVPVVIPLLPLLFLGLGTGPLPIGAATALLTLAVWLLAPMVAALDPRWWWMVPAVAVLGAAGLGGWALRSAHHSAAWPRPENLEVRVEADSAMLRFERLPGPAEDDPARFRIDRKSVV